MRLISSGPAIAVRSKLRQHPRVQSALVHALSLGRHGRGAHLMNVVRDCLSVARFAVGFGARRFLAGGRKVPGFFSVYSDEIAILFSIAVSRSPIAGAG